MNGRSDVEDSEPGSSAPSAPPAESLVCPHCGFQAKDEFGFRVHFGKKHRGQDLPEFADAPAPQERATPPPKPIRTPAELELIRAQLQTSIEALGGLLILFGRVVTGLALQRRAQPLSARAVAWGATNEGVMRAIVLINGALQGGELGQLLLPIAVAAAYDFGAIAPDRQIGPLSGVALLTLIAPELQEAERMHRQAERAMAAMHPDGESPEA